MSETDDKKLDEQIEKINQTEADLLRAMEIQEQMKDFVATAGQSKPADEKTASETDVVEALKTVCDPEIMINVYDMGLIYNIEIRDNGDVFIAMTLTAPGCPVAGILPQQVADAVALVEGTGKVEVRIVWEPAWTMERLSDDARAMIELF
jgi:FeS assembly SUF system protein